MTTKNFQKQQNIGIKGVRKNVRKILRNFEKTIDKK